MKKLIYLIASILFALTSVYGVYDIFVTKQDDLMASIMAVLFAAYTPVFSDTVRTIIYVIALIASVIGLGLMSFGHADIGGFVSTAAGIIAGGFGVAYNPLRQN